MLYALRFEGDSVRVQAMVDFLANTAGVKSRWVADEPLQLPLSIEKHAFRQGLMRGMCLSLGVGGNRVCD